MNVPGALDAYFHGPSFFHVGTVDRSLQPWRTCGYAIRIHDDRATATVLVGARAAARTLENLAHNPRLAIGGAQLRNDMPAFGIFESYQMKGTFLSSRDATAEEVERIASYKQAALASAKGLIPDEAIHPYVTGMNALPAIAITFRIDDVFAQTPGPGAGASVAAGS